MKTSRKESLSDIVAKAKKDLLRVRPMTRSCRQLINIMSNASNTLVYNAVKRREQRPAKKMMKKPAAAKNTKKHTAKPSPKAKKAMKATKPMEELDEMLKSHERNATKAEEPVVESDERNATKGEEPVSESHESSATKATELPSRVPAFPNPRVL